MWFLLLQIFFYLLIAAALGGWLMYWWLSRSHSGLSLTGRGARGAARQTPLTRDDLTRETAALRGLMESRPPPDLRAVEARLEALTDAVVQHQPTAVDLTPLAHRLDVLEQRLGAGMATLHPGPLHERLAGLEARIGGLSLDPVLHRVMEVGGGLAQSMARTQAMEQALAQRLQSLEQKLAELQPPSVDFGPLHSGIAGLGQAINGLEMPLRGIEPLAGRIATLETRLSEVGMRLDASRRGDGDMVQAQSAELRSLLETNRRASLDSYAAQLSELATRLESNRRSELDAIAARLNELGTRLEGARRNDMDTIAARFAAVTQAITSLRLPELSQVQARLVEIQAAVANIPVTNLQPLHAALSDLETFVVALDKPATDLRPLQNRLASIETVLAAMQADVRDARTLQPIERRLASLEEALGGLGEPDLTPVIGAVRALDARQNLVAVENRLTALEYGLAALHHMLRSRSEGGGARAESDFSGGPSLRVVREQEPAAEAARPARESDPINAFRRTNDEANLLSEPAFGAPDDLEAIDGVGPMLRALLHDIGVYYFWQVAEWSPREIDWVESKLAHFRGRIRRDDWVGQARALALQPGASKRPAGSARRPV